MGLLRWTKKSFHGDVYYEAITLIGTMHLMHEGEARIWSARLETDQGNVWMPTAYPSLALAKQEAEEWFASNYPSVYLGMSLKKNPKPASLLAWGVKDNPKGKSNPSPSPKPKSTLRWRKSWQASSDRRHAYEARIGRDRFSPYYEVVPETGWDGTSHKRGRFWGLDLVTPLASQQERKERQPGTDPPDFIEPERLGEFSTLREAKEAAEAHYLKQFPFHALGRAVDNPNAGDRNADKQCWPPGSWAVHKSTGQFLQIWRTYWTYSGWYAEVDPKDGTPRFSTKLMSLRKPDDLELLSVALKNPPKGVLLLWSGAQTRWYVHHEGWGYSLWLDRGNGGFRVQLWVTPPGQFDPDVMQAGGTTFIKSRKLTRKVVREAKMWAESKILDPLIILSSALGKKSRKKRKKVT